MQNNQKVLMLGGGTSSSMLLRLMASSTLVPVDDVTLSEFAVNDVEAALALSFITNEYRTGNSETTFADAFTGTSPKLTYSTAAGSNSTMVNSSGEIVWAPHNLVRYSENFSQSYWTKQAAGTGSTPVVAASSLTDPAGGTGAYEVAFDVGAGTTSGDRSLLVSSATATTTGVDYTHSIWVRGDVGGEQIVVRGMGNSAFDLFTLTTGWTRISATETANTTAGNFIIGIRQFVQGTLNSTATIHIWGAHLYRSDLGGMHPVPQAATGFEYYVPTNGNPEYLPRVGHHVYNGSTWVNEGLLIESEPRTNLEVYSNPTTPWFSYGLDYGSQTLRIKGPDGVADSMFKLQEDTSTGVHYFTKTRSTSVGTNTFSCIVKDAGDGRYVYWRTNVDGANQWINVNPATGEVTEVGTAVNDYGVIDLGNGFYRLWFSADTADGSTGWLLASSNSATPGNTIPSFTGTSEAGFYCGFVQVEEGSTPSSYMPTSGGTYTRTAQSLTVPPAQFGWPEPEFIGPDLVTDGSHSSLGSDWSYANGVYTASGAQTASQNIVRFDGIGIEEGKVYSVSCDIANLTAGNAAVKLNGGDTAPFTTNGTHTATLVGLNLNGFQLLEQNGFDGDVSNISVREINPLSVSIQMDGRMTYADEDVDTANPSFAYWDAGSNNYIHVKNNTYGASITGRLDVTQDNGTGSSKAAVSGNTAFSPGINVPFNISSRHGSTFVNGAVDGVALTANTDPTALPDLSGTDLEIAKDFMGTIGTFRQFAGDIGDTGLVTATNPSTEPTLSLTFDGTDGSFYNLSWSE